MDVRPEDPAYLLYTSGSTGQPKGVLVHHRGAYSYCQTAVDHFGITPDDRIAQVSNPAFDASIFDCYATLLAGATLISAPRETIADAAAFTDLIRSERVTLSFVPPAVLALLDPEDFAGSALRGLWSAGEALPPEQATRWPRPGLALHNSYGPTETTVVVTDYLCTDEPLTGPTPIGTALPNHRAYALDRTSAPRTDRRRPDELYIAGTGVTHGYHDRPGLTAERFLPDPYAGTPGERMYATGDLVRWRADGVLEFLGRRDRQVQLRGQRVELGEIEHMPHRNTPTSASARSCCATATAASRRLRRRRRRPRRRCAAHLADRLPTYMIPTASSRWTRLPRTPNGKLDTARAARPRTARPRPTATPRTDTERWLADIWQDLLGIDQVGAADNFFELGGNSLHVTQLAPASATITARPPPAPVFTDPV